MTAGKAESDLNKMRKQKDKSVERVRKIADADAAAFARVLRGWLSDPNHEGGARK